MVVNTPWGSGKEGFGVCLKSYIHVKNFPFRFGSVVTICIPVPQKEMKRSLVTTRRLIG